MNKKHKNMIKKIFLTLLYAVMINTNFAQEIKAEKIDFPKKIKKEIYKMYKKITRDTNNIIVLYVSYDLKSLSYFISFSKYQKQDFDTTKIKNSKFIRNELKFCKFYYLIIKNKKFYLIDDWACTDATGLVIKSRDPFILIECNKIKKRSLNGY